MLALRQIIGILLWLGLAFGASPAAFAQLQVLQQASATLQVAGNRIERDVTLPYNWDRQHGGLPGVGAFRLRFQLDRLPGEPYRLYFPRLGNAYEIWLNGVLLEREGDLSAFNSGDHGQIPRSVPVPAQLFRTDNVLEINIRADGGRRAGVPAPVLGPEAEIEQTYRRAYAWRATGSFVVVILSLVVGAVALALWLTQADGPIGLRRRRDPLYLYASIAEFSWALRVAAVVIEEPPLPWPLWGTIAAAALGTWVCCMVAFCLIVAGWEGRPWLSRALRTLWFLLAFCTVSAFVSLTWHLPWLLTLGYGALGLVVVPFAIHYVWATLRAPNARQVLVAGAMLTNVVVAMRDWAVFRFGDAFGSDTYTRYSSVLFGLTLGGIVLMRFGRASTQARELLASLEARVAEKEAELKSSYEQLEGLARKQERVAERTRVLRDLHDGVGSHISSAIRQLESGKATNADVLQTLRESLDQLKLSIDVMNVPPGDITALLANLRYRLEPRFAASDIELQWDVDLIEPFPALDAGAMRHLQFMVFEALSNVLQHANARHLRIDARAEGAGARLQIIDDGRGFDASTPARKGLSSMRERAAMIGAALSITSQPGRTVVQFALPGRERLAGAG